MTEGDVKFQDCMQSAICAFRNAIATCPLADTKNSLEWLIRNTSAVAAKNLPDDVHAVFDDYVTAHKWILRHQDFYTIAVTAKDGSLLLSGTKHGHQ